MGRHMLPIMRALLRIWVWIAIGALPCGGATPEMFDWPTVHRDNQRSGWCQQTVKGPWQRKWFRDFHDELISTRVQAIVGDGRVFVGTLAGTVRALGVADGGTIWTFQTGGPVGTSGCLANGHLYIGSDDGFLYCLRSQDGTEVWRYSAGAGIWAAPACDGRLVYVGDRAGVFHAVDARTGRAAGTFKTGGMILCPASFSPDGRRIIFGSEDMHVYCIDPAGALVWKSAKLGGLSMRDHAPCIWRGLAIVRTIPAVSYHRAAGENPAVLTAAQKSLPLLPDDRVLLDKWGQYVMQLTPRRLDAERQAVLAFLRDNPSEKTFYALRLEDGREPWTAPVLYTCGMHNSPTSPTFDPRTGELFTWFPTALTNYSAGVPGGAIAIGRLDRDTGLIEPLLHANSEQFNTHSGFAPPADETFALSLMGNTLLNTHQGIVGGLDLSTRRCGVLAGRRDSYGGIFGPAFVPDPWNGGSERAHIAGQLVYLPNEWHGPDRGIVAIAENRVFWVVGAQVVCLAGPDIPPASSGGDKPPAPIRRRTSRGTPGGNVASTSFGGFDAETPRPILTPEQVRECIRFLPPTGIPTADWAAPVRARLDEAVVELVEGYPWSWLVVELGPSGEEAHFQRTSETMQAVALAMPFLSPPVRDRAGKFLASMLAEGAPLKKPLHPGAEGTRRTLYDFGPEMLRYAAAAPRYQSGIEDLYALWACAHYAEQWKQVLAMKAAIQVVAGEFLGKPSEFNHADKFGDAAEHLNARIAGTLAYARIMAKAGDGAEFDRAEKRLAQLLTDRLHHEIADSELVRQSRRARFHLHQAQVPRYTALTPELGFVLRQLAGPKLRENLLLLDRALPVWHQAFCERMIGGESYTSTPNLARGLFMAMADGMIAPPEQLVKKLDQPWCRGDIYYIEKLAALLRAGGR